MIARVARRIARVVSAGLSAMLVAATVGWRAHAAAPDAGPGAADQDRGAPGDRWRAAALDSFDVAWQTIHDTFADPTFGGLDWNAVRTELRPEVQRAPTEDAARVVMREMLARLKASHFVLLSASATDPNTLAGDASAPIEIRILPAGVVIVRVTAPDGAHGLGPGQTIIAIDGHVTADWRREADGADSRARDLAFWRRVTRALSGVTGSIVELRVRDPGGHDTTVTVARTVAPGSVVTLGNLPPLHVTVSAREVTTPSGARVGIIAFNYWMTAIDEPLAAAVDRFRHDAGLVIDLRGNPGGLAAMMRGVAGHLVDEPLTIGTSHTRDATLVFTANPRRATMDGRRVTPFAGPVAILVDELTASTSECFAAGLQSLGRARVFGTRTMGEALPAVTKRLPDGDVLMYAVGDFVTSTGQRVEGAGVTPDTTVPLAIDALAAGADPVVEAAVKWVTGQSGSPGSSGSSRFSGFCASMTANRIASSRDAAPAARAGLSRRDPDGL